ncbi:MAG: RNA-directed DNA polymerase [Candidatus Eisenbacteria bacterium]|nr:RNA-directed DNA polymerase [Candidatus Eisenbacteria bacterium]
MYVPSAKLKAVQRWLLDEIVTALPVHGSAVAYRRGIGVRTNAGAHVGKSYLLRMDFEWFFPSILTATIRSYLSRVGAERLRLDPRWDVEPFLKLVCRFEHLVIGAPTSPALANALLHDFDAELDRVWRPKGVTYTRYADDLFFSTNTPWLLGVVEQHVRGAVSGQFCGLGLKLNEAKTRHLSARAHRRVTGVVLGSDGSLSIGRGLKRKIRALIHQRATLSSEQAGYLAGILAHAKSIEPEFRQRLIRKYGETVISQVQRGAVFTHNARHGRSDLEVQLGGWSGDPPEPRSNS